MTALTLRSGRAARDARQYISPAELSFAQPRPRSCALYRAHAVVDEPRFFNLEGDIGPDRR